MIHRLLIASASVVLITGCASILNDKEQRINVTTSTGKSVSGTVNGQAFSAPGIVNVARENKNKVFAVDDAACTRETVAEKSVDPVFFINVLSGGPFGSTTDYSTEKMWKYAETVTITCK